MNCPYCKEENIEIDANYCTNCGEDFKYKVIGGWLILLGIGVWISPFIMVFELYSFKDIFTDGIWEALTTKSSQYYMEYYGTVLIVEILVNSLFVIFSFYLIFLFSSKKIKFKKYYTIVSILVPLFLFFDSLVVKEIFSTEELFDKDSSRAFIKSIIGFCIWVPYLWLSKRSKKTFINL